MTDSKKGSAIDPRSIIPSNAPPNGRIQQGGFYTGGRGETLVPLGKRAERPRGLLNFDVFKV